jgi:hypothetical protein
MTIHIAAKASTRMDWTSPMNRRSSASPTKTRRRASECRIFAYRNKFACHSRQLTSIRLVPVQRDYGRALQKCS